MEKLHLSIDGRSYLLNVLKKVTMPVQAPRLVVVAYQPNGIAQSMLRVCIQAIQRYTPEMHELWVVDNNSPGTNADWLINCPEINIVLNRTEPLPPGARTFWSLRKQSKSQLVWGSYANAVALELSVRLINPLTQYLMSFHMDALPCRKGWLSFLCSKIGNGIAAAGVRMDRVRVPEGVLHVLGCLVDFQLFKQNGLDYFPQLPHYDVGDRVTVALRSSGYAVYNCPNTHWEPQLVKQISDGSPLYTLSVDRSFDDDRNVVFLHLGRGIRKSSGKNDKGVTPLDWIRFVNKHLLS